MFEKNDAISIALGSSFARPVFLYTHKSKHSLSYTIFVHIHHVKWLNETVQTLITIYSTLAFSKAARIYKGKFRDVENKPELRLLWASFVHLAQYHGSSSITYIYIYINFAQNVQMIGVRLSMCVFLVGLMFRTLTTIAKRNSGSDRVTLDDDLLNMCGSFAKAI